MLETSAENGHREDLRACSLEDFELGDRKRSREVSVARDAVLAFAAQYDPQPIHLDEEEARRGVFGELVASGWHTAVLTMKLMVDARLLGATPIIGVEVDRIRFEKPLKPGDILYAEAMVVAKRPSRKPGVGYLTVMVTTHRGDGAIVMSQQWTLLVPTKEEAGRGDRERHTGEVDGGRRSLPDA